MMLDGQGGQLLTIAGAATGIKESRHKLDNGRIIKIIEIATATGELGFKAWLLEPDHLSTASSTVTVSNFEATVD